MPLRTLVHSNHAACVSPPPAGYAHAWSNRYYGGNQWGWPGSYGWGGMSWGWPYQENR
jgi:hypothetical protein